MIIGRLFIVFGIIFFILTIISNYFDIKLHINGDLGVTQVGQVWYTLSSSSLQITEVIISRYIDPCSIIDMLNCSGFIWHPLIAWILTLPAAPIFIILSFILIKYGLKKSYGIRKKKYTRTEPKIKS